VTERRPASRLNREWHLANKMPRNATRQQRLEWHLGHADNCQCREMPAGLAAEVSRMREERAQRQAEESSQ
jgi:hypothetical protein